MNDKETDTRTKPVKKPWYKQKTTWAGFAGILGAATGFFTGTLPLAAAVNTAVVSLMGIFLRQGVEHTKQ